MTKKVASKTMKAKTTQKGKINPTSNRKKASLREHVDDLFRLSLHIPDILAEAAEHRDPETWELFSTFVRTVTDMKQDVEAAGLFAPLSGPAPRTNKSVSAFKQLRQLTAKESLSVDVATQIPMQPRAERSAFAKWLDTEIPFKTYEEAVSAGVKAFATTGKRVTKSQVRAMFSENTDGMAGLIFFIWDVTKNDCKATRRLRSAS